MILIQMKRDREMVYTPGVDMAMQEYVRKNIFLGDDIIMPYTTDPQVQMGRYQNAAKEVNMNYLEENNIGLVRRETGGGAIYLDRGNTSFCFLSNEKSNDTDLNFKKLYEPVIKILHDLGATEAELSGRNDLHINGQKVSGAAMSVDGERIYSGYSLQLDVDVDSMSQALTPNRKKIEAKGIDSVRSRVESIRPHLDVEYQDLSPKEFHELVGTRLLGVSSYDEAEEYVLTEEDWKNIDKICEDKYLNWDWVQGKNPKYSFKRDLRIEGVGTFELEADISAGRIKDIQIFGDFFGSKPISDVENALVGVRERREDLMNVLSQIDLNPYFNAQIDEELVDLILS